MLTLVKKTTFALSNEVERLTEYMWNGALMDSDEKFITLYNEHLIKVYNVYTEECVMSLDDLDWFEVCDSCIIVKKHEKCGAINFCGQEIVPIKYNEIEPCKNYIIVTLNNKEGVYFYNNFNHVPAAFEIVARHVEPDIFEHYFPARYKGIDGYYVFSTGKFHEAEKMEMTSSGEIRLCKKGKWRILKSVK